MQFKLLLLWSTDTGQLQSDKMSYLSCYKLITNMEHKEWQSKFQFPYQKKWGKMPLPVSLVLQS